MKNLDKLTFLGGRIYAGSYNISIVSARILMPLILKCKALDVSENEPLDICGYPVTYLSENDVIVIGCKHISMEQLITIAKEHDFYREVQLKDEVLVAVQQRGYNLKYIENQTFEICLAAVQENGFAFWYVEKKFQTSKVCEAVLQQGGYFEETYDLEFGNY